MDGLRGEAFLFGVPVMYLVIYLFAVACSMNGMWRSVQCGDRVLMLLLAIAQECSWLPAVAYVYSMVSHHRWYHEIKQLFVVKLYEPTMTSV